MHKHDSHIPQERHHVWPQGFHGPSTPDNLIDICCNVHSDIHYYMNYRLRHNGAFPDDWRTYSAGVRKWANVGYDKVMAYCEETAKQY